MADTKGLEQEPKIGVYVCHCGGNISDVIDVKRVAEEIAKIPGVALSTDYIFMCSDPGQQKVKEAIRSGAINRVVIAACSPRLHELTFRRALISAGLNPFLLEHVNIREQGSWVHKMDHEGATQKAIKLARGAVEKVRLAKPLDMIEIKSLPSALVIGAGPAGMRAAADLSRRNSKVYIIEKTPFTGGNTARMGKLYPTKEDAKEIISKLVEGIRDNAKIILLTCAEVVDSGGGIGNFKTKIRQMPRGVKSNMTSAEFKAAEAVCPVETDDEFNYGISKRKAIYMPYETAYPQIPAIDWKICNKCGKCAEAVKGKIELDKKEEIIEIETGIAIVATGYEHYQPYEGEYGFGKSPDIITLPQLIRMLDEKGPTKGAVIRKGRKIKNIGFIHCVGSRQMEGADPVNSAKTLNAHCSRVCCTAALQAIIEVKEKLPKVNVFDFYQDIRTYSRDAETLYYDNASKLGTLFFRYAPMQLPKVTVEKDKIKVTVKDLLTQGEEMDVEMDILVLATGMLPGNPGVFADKYKMPKSADRFLQEVHPKLRPVETAIGGIFLAGTVQSPFDTTETTAIASAAAIKAASILEGGTVQLEPFVAMVNRDKCKGHGSCVKVCPATGAIYMKDNKAEVNPVLCISCGNCVAVCPERAIDVQGFEINTFEKLVDEIVKS